jgi:hypothetical protein
LAVLAGRGALSSRDTALTQGVRAPSLIELVALLMRHGMSDVSARVNFAAAASLRKWPSARGQRLTETKCPSPYTILESTLGECLRELMLKPLTQRHLYEIHTSPQDPLIGKVILEEQAVELARLRSFLEALG